MFDFDRVQILPGGTDTDETRAVSRHEWLAIDAVERLRLVMEGRVEFLRENEPVSALEELASSPGASTDGH